MCGIVAYLGSGNKDAADVLIAGLKRLEYRGYDSAGIALVGGQGQLRVVKKKGKVANLEASYRAAPSNATTGIGHTRWATHGEPADRNSHPHTSMCGGGVGEMGFDKRGGASQSKREIAVVRGCL